MEKYMGLLRIHVQRGVNLAVRDVRSSDPYAVFRLGRQKVKTRVVKQNINPEWNEDLTLSILDPKLPVRVLVYDKFSLDDPMGEAEFEIGALLEGLRMHLELETIPDGCIITKVQPSRQNCLAEESSVVWKDGKVVQNMVLRLRNVESGEIELQLQWIDIPGSRGI